MAVGTKISPETWGNKRLCTNCLLNEIENENDVLFACTLDNTIRMKYNLIIIHSHQ